MPSPIQSQLPQEYLDLLDTLNKRVEQLSRALVASYELSDPLSIGGPTGVYTLKNPYSTPCEYSIVSFSAFAAASATISTQNNLPQLAATGALSQAGGSADPGSQVIVLATAGQGSAVPSDKWFPLANGENITMAVTAAGGNGGYLTVALRRRKTPAGVVVF